MIRRDRGEAGMPAAFPEYGRRHEENNMRIYGDGISPIHC